MISVPRFTIVKDRLLQSRGDLRLFALVLRDDSPDRWDVDVSAPWADKNLDEALQYVSSVIVSTLDPNELLLVSRVIILEDGNPVLTALLAAAASSSGELRDRDLGGIEARLKRSPVERSQAILSQARGQALRERRRSEPGGGVRQPLSASVRRCSGSGRGTRQRGFIEAWELPQDHHQGDETGDEKDRRESASPEDLPVGKSSEREKAHENQGARTQYCPTSEQAQANDVV
jgi:hypothetical protein